MSLEHIINTCIEEGRVFDIVDINLGSHNPLLGRVVVENWDPEVCKTVDYWYDALKPELCDNVGSMEFYRLSSSDYVDFKMKYKNIEYRVEGSNTYLVVTDNLQRFLNYRWYLQHKDALKPSNLKRSIYKWNPNYNRWEDSSKYTCADINSYTGIREVYDNILSDTELLTTRSDILEKLGLSPSINYLIGSAPGMGKTSLIKCIATTLNVDIHVIDHKAITSSDPSLIFGSSRSRDNINVYIFEDFDRYLKSSKSEQMASLLNALDGVEKMPPSLRFFTTNSKIVGEEFKAFYTRMRRIINFTNHSDEAYSRSINIVLGSIPYEEQLIQSFRDNSISMREANQLLVSSLLQDNPLQYILHNITLRSTN